MKIGVFTSDKWFFALRVFLPLLMLTRFFSFVKDLQPLWFDNGLVKADILAVSHSGNGFGILDILAFFQHQLGMSTLTFNALLQLLIGLYLLALLLLCTGLFTRASAFCTLCLHLVFYVSFFNYTYGVDNFITMLLFYLLISKVPQGTPSLDRLLFRRAPLNFGFEPSQMLKLVQVHLSIVYLFSGLEKALGVNWWNGESIWRALHNEFGLIDLAYIDGVPAAWVFVVAGWTAIATELFYPLFINLKKTRLLWVSLTIGMHCSIIVFLGLFHFGAVMILFNLTAYVIPYLNESREQQPEGSQSLTGLSQPGFS